MDLRLRRGHPAGGEETYVTPIKVLETRRTTVEMPVSTSCSTSETLNIYRRVVSVLGAKSPASTTWTPVQLLSLLGPFSLCDCVQKCPRHTELCADASSCLPALLFSVFPPSSISGSSTPCVGVLLTPVRTGTRPMALMFVFSLLLS